jgi:hypothetical protein
MKLCGIYKIQSISHPERCYIGSAVDLNHRRDTHLSDLRKNKHGNKKLQHHFNKYGESDFQFFMMLGCEKEYLIANEQFFIDSYNPFFNIAKIAGSQLGFKHSEESNRKNSESHKGRRPTEETRKKLGDSHRGIKKSKESIQKIADANRRRHITDETRKKLSDSHKGKRPSEETRQKQSESRKGHLVSEETRLKISLSQIGKKRGPLSEELKKKISESHMGRRNSADAILRASIHRKRPVLQYDLQGNFIKEWVGAVDACRELHINRSTLCQCCNPNHRIKSAGGFIWKLKRLIN